MFRKFAPIPHLSVWLIAMVFLFSNCNSPDTGEAQQVAAVIDSFYRTEPLGNYRLVDQRWLSRELCQELRKCGQIQHDDSLRLKLLGSTDKPRMMEGDPANQEISNPVILRRLLEGGPVTRQMEIDDMGRRRCIRGIDQGSLHLGRHSLTLLATEDKEECGELSGALEPRHGLTELVNR